MEDQMKEVKYQLMQELRSETEGSDEIKNNANNNGFELKKQIIRRLELIKERLIPDLAIVVEGYLSYKSGLDRALEGQERYGEAYNNYLHADYDDSSSNALAVGIFSAIIDGVLVWMLADGLPPIIGIPAICLFSVFAITCCSIGIGGCLKDTRSDSMSVINSTVRTLFHRQPRGRVEAEHEEVLDGFRSHINGLLSEQTNSDSKEDESTENDTNNSGITEQDETNNVNGLDYILDIDDKPVDTENSAGYSLRM